MKVEGSTDSRIFFIHVPKTAGSTVSWIFAEIFGLAKIIKLGVYGAGKFMTMADFWALPPERIVASPVIIGHFCWGCQNRIAGAAQVGMALRDPCTRVLSYLDYQRRATGGGQTVIAKLRTDPECNNGMVRRLCGLGEFDGQWWDFLRGHPAEPLAALGPKEFDLACANLSRADTVLLTEKFVDGSVIWRHRLGMPPLVSIANQFRNHAPRPTDSANWPADFVAEVRERNALDYRLYELAQARADADLKAANPDQRNEMIAMRSLAGALSQRGQSNIGLRQGVDLVLQTINRLMVDGHPEIGVRVGYLLAERAPLPIDLWTPVTAVCRRVCPDLEGEIDAARLRAETWAKIHPPPAMVR